jgi:hypothetical protein
VFGVLLLLAYSLGHVVMLFLAGACSGFASAYLQGKGGNVGLWLHRTFGTALVLVGVWVLWGQLRSTLMPPVASVLSGHFAKPAIG